MRRLYWEILAVFCSLGVIVLIMLPVFERAKENANKSSCPSNLKQIGLGIAQYTQDYDEKYPVIVAGGEVFGWLDSLQPYLKSTQLFQCGAEGNSPEKPLPRKIGYTDYWFNQNMAQKELEEVRNPSILIAMGDGNDGGDATDARYSLEGLPSEWISNRNSPAYRHMKGANYGFADGHVKWCKPQDVNSSASKYRFKLK